MAVESLRAVPPGPVVAIVASGPKVAAVGGAPTIGAASPSTGVVAVSSASGARATSNAPLGGALALAVQNLEPIGGVLTIDVSQANTAIVIVTAAITVIRLVGFPPAGRSERVTIYFQQDDVGGHVIYGWPPNVKWSGGLVPVLPSQAGDALDCVVFDSTDGGATILGNLVGIAYS